MTLGLGFDCEPPLRVWGSFQIGSRENLLVFAVESLRGFSDAVGE